MDRQKLSPTVITEPLSDEAEHLLSEQQCPLNMPLLCLEKNTKLMNCIIQPSRSYFQNLRVKKGKHLIFLIQNEER